VLRIVQPDTVTKWHRLGFKLYWRWKSTPKSPGRPPIDKGIRDLIRRMARDNPLWGAPHICSELHLLGYDVAQATVSKYMSQRHTPPSQTWRTFLNNHVQDIVAIDFFTVPTLTFRVLYGFLVLRHDQRMVVHFNATEHPTAQWVAQQIVEAFPFDEAPRFLLRDRDAIYGAHFQQRVRNMGIEAVVIAPQSPWQNPYAERMIGTLRRELLDHVIVLKPSPSLPPSGLILGLLSHGASSSSVLEAQRADTASEARAQRGPMSVCGRTYYAVAFRLDPVG
jgi:transposase InsO family protein